VGTNWIQATGEFVIVRLAACGSPSTAPVELLA
jgi:hypothetical protein